MIVIPCPGALAVIEGSSEVPEGDWDMEEKQRRHCRLSPIASRRPRARCENLSRHRVALGIAVVFLVLEVLP